MRFSQACNWISKGQNVNTVKSDNDPLFRRDAIIAHRSFFSLFTPVFTFSFNVNNQLTTRAVIYPVIITFLAGVQYALALVNITSACPAIIESVRMLIPKRPAI
jgi:CHASE1-domain containing sensor protein